MTSLKIWNDILRDNPNPRFSRRSVHSLWSKLNEVDWKRAEDPLTSASLLIKEAEDGKLGNEKVQMINLPTEEGFTALAWSLPNIIARWGGRIREVVLESACKRSLSGLYMLVINN